MSAAAFETLRGLARDHAGIMLEPGKEYLAEDRLVHFARESGFGAVEGLAAALRGKPFGDLHRRVVELLTTNETSFFRDAKPFDSLRAQIIPQLLAARPDRRVTFWCAAASSGQEPYSVAILMREHFPRVPVRILASDISREMVARIAAGTYSPFEVTRGLASGLLAKHFTHAQAGGWQVKPELRAMVEPMEINLSGPLPALPRVDVLLCRNVLIYFDPATKQQILARVRRTLSPDGVILLGGGESTIGLDTDLERTTADNKAAWYRPR